MRNPYFILWLCAFLLQACPAHAVDLISAPVVHPDSLTLKQAIAIALSENPELTAGQWDVQSARARRDGAAGARLPRLDAVGGYSRYLDAQRLTPASANSQPGVFGEDLFSAGLIVNVPLFTGGRLLSEFRSAERLQEAAEHRLDRSREDVIFRVTGVFYGILAQQHVVRSIRFSEEALTEHLRRVNDLIAAQKAARLDRLRTEVRLSDLNQQRIRAENALAVQKRILATLLGRKASVEISGKLGASEPDTLSSLASGVALALRRRGDYLAAQAALQAQTAAVDAARGGRWPTVFAQATYARRWMPHPSDLPTGAGKSDDAGAAGIFLSIPVFEGGRISAQVRDQQARLAAAQERLRKLELQIRTEVETSYLDVTSAWERIRTTEKAIAPAQESLRIEREKYNLGKGSITDVLDAQSALLIAQTNHDRALADLAVANARYQLAVGEIRQ